MNSPASSLPDSQKQKRVGAIAYVFAGLSFIPCLGVLFGLIAIVWGIAKGARTLVWLGISGILITLVLYGSLFYFGMYQRGGIYDQLRRQLAVTELDETVRRIEYYKLQNGHYPAKITDIVSKDTSEFPTIEDPTAIERQKTSDSYFYYELNPSGSFYYLRSVGPDGIPFTSDDILPDLPESEREKTGLRLEKEK